jgi:hypothetical protein
MARDRFPSDEKRLKVRPHVRVHLTARTHRKTAAVFADATLRGQFLGLLMVAREAHAGRTGDTLHLSRADVAWISGRSRPDIARKSLQYLANILEYPFEVLGEVVRITIRNFAKKQGLHSAGRGVSRIRTPQKLRTPHPSESESESETEKRRGKRTAPAAPAPPAPTTGNGEAEPETADVLSPRFLGRLRNSTPPRLGEVSDSDIRDWFADVAPKLRSRGYQNLERAALSWWERCTPEELKRARANGGARRLEPIRREIASRPAEEVPPEAFDFDIKRVGEP